MSGFQWFAFAMSAIIGLACLAAGLGMRKRARSWVGLVLAAILVCVPIALLAIAILMVDREGDQLNWFGVVNLIATLALIAWNYVPRVPVGTDRQS